MLDKWKSDLAEEDPHTEQDPLRHLLGALRRWTQIKLDADKSTYSLEVETGQLSGVHGNRPTIYA